MARRFAMGATHASDTPKPVTIYDRRRRPLVRRQVIEKRYGISGRTLDNWMKSRKVPFIKIGHLLFFSVEECDRALERYTVKEVTLNTSRKGKGVN
jgi:hypothetical protein